MAGKQKQHEQLRERSHVAQIRTEKWTVITLVVTALGVIDLFWPGLRGQVRSLVQQVVHSQTPASAAPSEGLSTVVTVEGGRRVVRLYATNVPVALQSLRRVGLSEQAVTLSRTGEVRLSPRGERDWEAARALAARIGSDVTDRIVVVRKRPYLELLLE